MLALACAALAALQQPVPAIATPAPIRAWLITRPLPTDTGAARVTRDYLGGETTAFPDSDAAWRPVVAGPDGLVDLNTVLGGVTNHTAVYAFAYVRSPRDETRTLILTSDDDVEAWLNGQLIHRHITSRGVDVERDSVTVRLAGGWNALLLKVVNRQGGFGYGAWLDGLAPATANRRPPDAQPGTLPAATITLGALRLTAPFTWSGDQLRTTGAISVAAWGAGVPSAAAVRVVLNGDTVARGNADSLVPGQPRAVVLPFSLATLGRLGTSDAAQLVAVWPKARVTSGGAADAATTLTLLGGRLALDWQVSDTVLVAHVTVPPALAGLTLDLIPAELGPAARYSVNGAARAWAAGTVALCEPCGAGDTLAIRIGRPAGHQLWDLPRARVRDRTYADVARNVALLPALGDSSGRVALPDPRVWLAATLQADKRVYRVLVARYDSLLAPLVARVRADTIHLVGNSHIDAAWLWPYAETWGVVENTWRTELKIQQKFPGATFAASSAQYYRWLDTRAPGLVDSIRAAANAGTWSVVGGWWLEADQNIPGGESLVRQGLYGQRYFQRTLGRRSKIAWTPDSFGYPWSMPQIWRGLGMTTFVTQKIRWNDSTEFPYDAFVWQGRDGTRVFSYNPWGYDHDLDGSRLAQEMRSDNARTDSAHQMLVLYGVGDHGGGPTIDMLDRRDDLRRLPAYPVLIDDTPERALQTVRAAHPDAAWPVWSDELYLEYHRGTYTTQSWMKRRNRRSEELLGTAEMLAALDTAPYPRRDLEQAWHQVLFNQFHDLLPGSGIHRVYLDAMRTYDSAQTVAAAVRDAAFARLRAQVDTRGEGVPIVVFNPSSWVRSSYAAVLLDSAFASLKNSRFLRAVDAAKRATLAEVDGDTLRFLAREVPSLGFKVFWIRTGSGSEGTLTSGPAHLENDFLAVDVDTTTGQITRLYDKRAKRDALAPGGRGNALQLFGDQPRQWDAWDIGYTGERWPLDSVRRVRRGSDEMSTWIEVEKPWNGTRIVQRLILRRDEPLLVVDNAIDWHETHRLLKVAFDWNVTADSATYEIAYGAIGQPTAPRTQAERAKYEHAGHRWADLSGPDFGVSLLNDSKYGWDTRGHTMRLSLLRAPLWPDSLADRGPQRFQFAVYPHTGDWRAALTERRGQEFNWPLLAAPEPGHGGVYGHSWSFATVAAENVYVTALKRAEDSDAWVLRLVEWHGRPATTTLAFGRRIARVRIANLLEDPAAALPVARDGRTVTLTLRPWEILTLLVEEAR
jgi:alpha-mannosidase